MGTRAQTHTHTHTYIYRELNVGGPCVRTFGESDVVGKMSTLYNWPNTLHKASTATPANMALRATANKYTTQRSLLSTVAVPAPHHSTCFSICFVHITCVCVFVHVCARASVCVCVCVVHDTHYTVRVAVRASTPLV